jgi:hypothetical protein
MRIADEMNRKRVVALAVGVALAVTGCGGGGNDAPSGDAAPEPTPTSTATATATASPKTEPKPTPAPGKCDQVKVPKPPEPAERVHPGFNFYEPDADNLPTKGDLDYLILHDNVVVVTYAASTPKATRDRLDTWWATEVVKRTPVVVPDRSRDALPVRARIATAELRCNGFDWKRMTKFANRTDIAPLPHEDEG